MQDDSTTREGAPLDYTVTSLSVSFGGKIPTQSYGNVDIHVSWSAEVAEGESPEVVTQDIYKRIRDEVTKASMPIAQAKIAGAYNVIRSMPPAERQAFMAQWGAVEWLNTVTPETAFAATDRVVTLQQEVDTLRAQLAKYQVDEIMSDEGGGA